jgi:hypothetical protein
MRVLQPPFSAVAAQIRRFDNPIIRTRAQQLSPPAAAPKRNLNTRPDYRAKPGSPTRAEVGQMGWKPGSPTRAEVARDGVEEACPAAAHPLARAFVVRVITSQSAVNHIFLCRL